MKTNNKINLTVITGLFLLLTFIFAGCEAKEDGETYIVDFYFDDMMVDSLDVQKGYKIPKTDNTIKAHACERGLYRGTTEDIDKFWTVYGGSNAGEIWDFNQPVNENLTLTAVYGIPPEKVLIGGRGKDFYDNVMTYINDRKNTGSYIMVLGEDAGVKENEGAGIKNREVKNVTFSPGVDLTIIGIGGERTISTKDSGVLVLPGNSDAPIKLTIGNNITIEGGEASSNRGMIQVGAWQGGDMEVVFTMLDGSKITGYTTEFGGSTVIVHGASDKLNNKVLFHMKGGIITGNVNLWKGGGSNPGVSINRAKIIIEGNAQITGNIGFGGDMAYGYDAGWPIPEEIFIELKGNATIGEFFLFANRGTPEARSPNIRIHDGWSGKIHKLNLGRTGYVTDPYYWVSYSFLRNASTIGTTAVGTISAFIPNISLGESFRFDLGHMSPQGDLKLEEYEINPNNGRLRRR